MIYREAPVEPLLLPLPLAARALGLSARYLQQLTADGKIPHVRAGRRVLFDPADLRRWIASNKRGASPSAE